MLKSSNARHISGNDWHYIQVSVKTNKASEAKSHYHSLLEENRPVSIRSLRNITETSAPPGMNIHP